LQLWQTLLKFDRKQIYTEMEYDIDAREAYMILNEILTRVTDKKEQQNARRDNLLQESTWLKQQIRYKTDNYDQTRHMQNNTTPPIENRDVHLIPPLWQGELKKSQRGVHTDAQPLPVRKKSPAIERIVAWEYK
jgi:predicted nuclease with TOPRIM domain